MTRSSVDTPEKTTEPRSSIEPLNDVKGTDPSKKVPEMDAPLCVIVMDMGRTKPMTPV
jgi:hypothetical protein